MTFLLRYALSTELRCLKMMKPQLNLAFNVNKIPRAYIHHSAVCNIEKDIMIEIFKQQRTSSEIIKEPKREPYMKSLLLATLDRELIVYPQVLNKERYMFLDEMVEAVKTYFENEVDGKLIDEKGEVPDTVVKDLKALGLFGLIIPEEYGGLGFSMTEFCRIAEAIAVNPSISISLIAHQCLAAKAIMDYGTKEQKDKYLPLMATGEQIGAFCFTEESGGSDPSSLQATIDINSHDDVYILAGTKTWVTNGRIADIFIVIGNELSASGEDAKLTAVIVQKSDENKISVERQPSLGMKGAYLATVTFDQTYLTRADVLGTRRGGLEISLQVYNFARVAVGAICTGLSAHLVEICNEYIVSRKMYNVQMSDLENVREKILYMSAKTYGIESLTYFVAALDDLYVEQDYSIESCALKLMASNTLMENTNLALKILAAKGCDPQFPYERHVRDALSLSNFLGSNDVTSLVVALDCLQFCGNNMKTLILKKRNILEHPHFNMKRMFRNFLEVYRNNNTFSMDIHTTLHPVLKVEARDLERLIVYLSYGIEKSLVYFGSNLASEQHQFITSRIGMSTCTSIMLLSALSRASRSACLGFPESIREVDAVKVLFKLYDHSANHYIAEIFTGIDCLQINKRYDSGNDVISAQKYNIKSPVFRTIW